MKTFLKRALWARLSPAASRCSARQPQTRLRQQERTGCSAATRLSSASMLRWRSSGNAVSVIGDAVSLTAPAPAAPASVPAAEPAPVAPVVAGTSGEEGIGSGNQALVDVNLPVTVSGNAVSVLGDSTAVSTAPAAAPAEQPAESSAWTTGEDGILSGNQGIISVDVPIDVTGNAVSVIGDSTALTWTAPAAPAGSGTRRNHRRHHQWRRRHPFRQPADRRRRRTDHRHRQRRIGHRRQQPSPDGTRCSTGTGYAGNHRRHHQRRRRNPLRQPADRRRRRPRQRQRQRRLRHRRQHRRDVGGTGTTPSSQAAPPTPPPRAKTASSPATS